ncbi:hypothetical protein KIL84_002616 [Mauremys mutica]|uniref:Uncharacterized protein n=1 Tax=Mauremys mutica TaxID=74926 RepID=A0A9D3X6N7_9SAUR|nr:hypothetical protein KIL84_002616 [Mauremys mutica]
MGAVERKAGLEVIWELFTFLLGRLKYFESSGTSSLKDRTLAAERGLDGIGNLLPSCGFQHKDQKWPSDENQGSILRSGPTSQVFTPPQKRSGMRGASAKAFH